MADEILENLNPFAARFARSLFERYPEWRRYVVPPNPKWQAIDDLAVAVPSRFAPYCPLRVETMRGAILVSWGMWHVHCDLALGISTYRRQIAKAFRTIRHILDEYLIVVEHWHDGCFKGSGDCKPAKLKRCLKGTFLSTYQVTARSWRGTYDHGEIRPERL